MPRWITFDESTASMLHARRSEDKIFEAPGRNAIEFAAMSQAAMIAVLPQGDQSHSDDSVIAVFRRPVRRVLIAPQRQAIAPDRQPPIVPDRQPPIASQMTTRAGGFLGLRDESFFEEEPKPEEKKAWWKKFWPDDE